MFTVCLAGQSAKATTLTWNGAGSDWSTAGDWTPNQVPGATDLTQFSTTFTIQPSTGTTASNTGEVYLTTGVGQDVTIGGTATLTIAGNLTTATGGGGVATTAILLDDTANHNLTISAPVSLSNTAETDFTVNNTGTLTISNPLSLSTNAAGTLSIGAPATTVSPTTPTDNAGGTVDLNGISTTTTNTVFVNTKGTVNLAGTYANTGRMYFYNGATTLSSATLSAPSELFLENSDTVTLAGASTVTPTNSTGVTIGAGSTLNVNGTSTITAEQVSVGGNLVLNSTTALSNTSTLNVSAGGVVTVANAASLGSNPLAFGGGGALQSSAGSTVNVTNTINLNGAGGLTVAGSNPLTLSGPVNNGSSSYSITVNNTGATAFTGGTVFINASTLSARTLTFNGTSNFTIGDVITDLNAASPNLAGNLTYSGSGNLSLTNVNTYRGTTNVNGGTLTLDFANAIGGVTTNLIGSTNALALGGGTFNLTGVANTTNSQTFGTTTVNAGASGFTINNNATANPDSVALGTLTRAVGGTVNFTQPANGTVSATNGYATGTGTASTILLDSGSAAYATVGPSDWAAKDSSNTFIVGGSTIAGFYTANTSSTLSGNADMSTGNTTLAAPATITSLRFNAAAANRTITATSQTLATGGILIGSGVGSNNTFITGGTLEGAASRDLPIIQNSTGTLTISSIIANNTNTTGLTKSGTGAVVLSASNTYAGTTTLNAGTLTLSNSAGSTTSGTTNVNGGTLIATNTSSGSATGTGAVNINNGGTLLGTGRIVQTTNSVTINSGGTIGGGSAPATIGMLTLTTTSTAGVTFNGGANYLATDLVDINSTTSDKLAITGSLTLTGVNDQITFNQLATPTASSYTLITYSGTLTGTFGEVTNLPTGYALSYVAGAIDLVQTTPVPEPSPWMMGLGCLGLLGWTQRRRIGL